MSDYDFFMVFELIDSGERVRVDVPENDIQSFLHPEQVFVFVKEPIRRIFIWKGAKSPVRKRFISSRVASELQEELVKQAAFHRCKIVSVDQGDEPTEFLRAFQLKSMKVEEKMEDLRYVRNIERETPERFGDVLDSGPTEKTEEEEEYFSPALQELKEKGASIDVNSRSDSSKSLETKPKPAPKIVPPANAQSRSSYIMEKILRKEIPKNYTRQNLILGNALYGAVSKTVNVFGKNVEETEWEPISQLPEEMVEVDDSKLRIYIDNEKNIIEAIEILRQKDKKTEEKVEEISDESLDLDHMTIKELKQYSNEHEIDLPSNARKADIIKTIKDSEDSPESNPRSTRRNLPKIPNNDE